MNSGSTERTIKNRGKLATVTIVRVVILIVVIVTGLYFAIAPVLKRTVLNVYQEFSETYTSMLADNVVGDTIEGYLKTGETDVYYNDISMTMQAMVDSAQLRYLYIFVPEEKGIVYVWDAQDGVDPRPLLDFWEYTEEYPKEDVLEVYRSGEKKFSSYKYKDMELVSCIEALHDSSGKIVAVVQADVLLPRVVNTLQDMLGSIFPFAVAAILIPTIIFYFVTRKSIIRPVYNIYQATEHIVENLDTGEAISIDVHTKDELESVARSIEQMNEKLKDYIYENAQITAEKERANTELELASKIQRDMLPGIFPPFPERKEFDIYASMAPAKEVGGDFYDFFFIDHDHFAMVIADVSGKGVPAAMFMMMAKCMIQTSTTPGLAPSEILARVNDLICENNREQMFVTVWLGILDVATGKLIASNAGHEYPIIQNPEVGFEVLKDRHSFVLGGKKNMKYADYEINLAPGSKLFVYTDGVPEATDASHDMFGMDRTIDALNKAVNGGPCDVLNAVNESVSMFVGDSEQFDDLTMMCVEYHGTDNNTNDKGEVKC